MTASIDTLILSRRKALPSHDLTGQRFRRVIAATCTAEVEHASRDVRGIGLDTGAYLGVDDCREADSDDEPDRVCDASLDLAEVSVYAATIEVVDRLAVILGIEAADLLRRPTLGLRKKATKRKAAK